MTSGFPEARSTDSGSISEDFRLLSKPYSIGELSRVLREAFNEQAELSRAPVTLVAAHVGSVATTLHEL
jgi:hypothetical protein